MGRKCYAIGEYEATDSLYNIFEKIFDNESELENFFEDMQNIMNWIRYHTMIFYPLFNM